MKIYGNLDLRTGDLYEDDVKTYGIGAVNDDSARDNLSDIVDGQVVVTLHDYTLNMYDTTSQVWSKLHVVDPVESKVQYSDNNAHIDLSTGHLNMPISNVSYSDRTTTDQLMDFYFKGEFQNWDVISRLTGADKNGHSLGLTWNEYYGLCIHVSDQEFHDTRIFPTTDAWHHFSCRQDYVNGMLDFSLDGFRIYQTPVVPLVNPTQLRLGQSDIDDGYDTTSLWINGYKGKIAQFRLATNVNRNYVGNSFTVFPYREVPDVNTEIFISPEDAIVDLSPNNNTPSVVEPATLLNDDSPFDLAIIHDIVSDQHRTFFHNKSATTHLIFRLPAVEDQLIFGFVRFGTNYIKIIPQFGEKIIGDNGNNTSINWDGVLNNEDTANSIIVLKGNSDGNWDITTVKGMWYQINNYSQQ